ncbi:maltokinase N-terminal cap-like domain-containing protein [Nocardia thailandica]|uniref:maltokinase N-terminal cap-like domain-containing protein n=1 Tax=Nocardia thailandica TaxID=257275 RepID=UPI0002F2BDC2|nr:hypothetical protein [Nocardia thailandica]
MAVVHRASLTPGKLDLLTAWLPGRAWYRGAAPRLRRAGGFRLDDPEGEVGLEFVLVADDSGAVPVLYHVPMSYRGVPLPGAEHALIGTAEHGVLGRRWIYDGPADPVLAAVTLDLLAGAAPAQHQHASATPDPAVRVRVGDFARARPGPAVDGDAHTDVGAGSAVLRFQRTPSAVDAAPRVVAEVAAPPVLADIPGAPVVLVQLLADA